MTTFDFRLYGISFLLMGFNIYASAFFTALNNYLVSAVLPKTKLYICFCATVLPKRFLLTWTI